MGNPMQASTRTKLETKSMARKDLIPIVLISIAIFCINHWAFVGCEPKSDFDWNELGLSLAGQRPSAPTYNGSSNLRIFVSPQRRMTKSYEFDYANNSQPQGETTYVIPGSSNPYASQPTGSQLVVGPSQGHSAAYSALSASIASLKNRLTSRGPPVSDQSIGQQNIYHQQPASSYGSEAQQQNQLQQQQQQQPGQHSQGQTTYLSVTGPQDHQSASNQAHDNKTIVLAIPAKINFLTEGRSNSNQKSNQQLAVIQSSQNEHQQQYAGKQLGFMTGQDGSNPPETAVQDQVQPQQPQQQQQQQYLIVNSQTPGNEGHHQLMAASAGPVALTQGSYPLGNVYQTIQSSSLTDYAPQTTTKYIPIQGYQPQPVASMSYDSVVDQASPVGQSGARYISCLDTCSAADPRWKRYSSARYRACCPRSSQQDPQYDQPAIGKVSETISKFADDGYNYNHLQRKSRGRRSRRTQKNRTGRYSPAGSTITLEEEVASAMAGEPSRSRQYYNEPTIGTTYSKHLDKGGRLVGLNSDLASSEKQGQKERSAYFRRGKSRDLHEQPDTGHGLRELGDEEGSYPESVREPSSYGSSSSYISSEPRMNEEDFELRGASYDDISGEVEPSGSKLGDGPDYEPITDTPNEDQVAELESNSSYRGGYQSASVTRRRKHLNKPNSRKSSKDSKKRNRNKNKLNAKQERYSSQAGNGTSDYDSTQLGESPYQVDGSSSMVDESGEQQSSYHQTSAEANSASYPERDGFSSKGLGNKVGLNDSMAVATLSKTTMHLKEILSLLDKKVNSKAGNDTGIGYTTGQSQQAAPVAVASSSVGQQQTTTSTQAPMTTTGLYSPYSLLNSQFASSALSSALSSDYLNSPDLTSLKSPYRFETPGSLSASLSGSSFALPANAYSQMSPSLADAYSSLSGYSAHSQYPSLSASKLMPSVHHPRKRRLPKQAHIRYPNPYLLSTPQSSSSQHGLGASAALLQAAAAVKNPLLKQTGTYSGLHYPYWYPRTSNSATNAYPYKNLNKNPYSSLLSGSVPSKLISNLYSDETRYPSLSLFDPISSVASSLRPTTNLRMKSKPFIFQPQVLPIYTRHSILTQPMDTKK